MKSLLKELSSLLQEKQRLIQCIEKEKHVTKSKKVKKYVDQLMECQQAYHEKFQEFQDLVTPQKKTHVLLVEDQPLAACVASSMMAKHGCSVDIVDSGRIALEQVSKQTYDVVLLDLSLPDMDGLEVAEKMHRLAGKQKKQFHIVALTAYQEQEVRQQCLDVGIDHIIVKPLSDNDIRNLMDLIMPLWDNQYLSTFRKTHEKIHSDIHEERSERWLSDFVTEFQQKEKLLQGAHRKGNWENVKFIAHGLKGSASYCGMRRLKEACAELESHVNQNHKQYYEASYTQLLEEMRAVEKLYTFGYLGTTHF